jgi:hypothetical protein
MGAYKQFLTSDIVVTPLTLNKSFYFEGAAALTASNVGIDRFLGLCTSSLFNPVSDPTTGQITTQYQRLIYSSIQELYYSNYLNSTASLGSPVYTASLYPGSDSSGDVLVGPTSSAGRYWNYPQTTLIFEHYFPTTLNSYIGVLSIPVGLFGNYIQPGTFTWSADSGSVHDDGQGNLIFDVTNEICGQIFYPHGIAVLTSDSQPQGDVYGTAIFGSSLYGLSDSVVVQNFVNSSNVTCSFSSSLTIYETQFKCTAGQNEFNFSQNPSISSGSTTITSSMGNFLTPGQYIYPFATSSYFTPYVTTIGLYDEYQNLLAVGKLSQPLPLSPTTDTTILVNIDR